MKGALWQCILALSLGLGVCMGGASAEDAPAGVVNVKTFGAKGDGTGDDTAALNAAAAAIPASGGILYIPPGRYAIAGTRGASTYGTTYVGVRLRSNTAVRCDGATLAGVGPNVGSLNVLVNANFELNTALTDTNIRIDGCDFSMPGTSGSAVVFWFASHVSATNNTVHNGGDGIETVGVLDADISGNRVYGNGNAAFDNFWGSSRLRIVNNYAEPLGAPEGANTNSWGVQLTNTNIANEDVTMDDILLEGNSIYYAGTALNTGAPIGVDGTVTGHIDHLVIAHNHLYNTGPNSGNPNLFLISAGSGWTITGNVLDGSKIYPAIFGLSGNQTGAIVANNVLSNCSHVSPPYSGNIMFQGTHNTAANNRQLSSCAGTMISLAGDGNVVLGNEDEGGTAPNATGGTLRVDAGIFTALTGKSLTASSARLGPVAVPGSGLGALAFGSRGIYSVAPQVSVEAPPDGGTRASVAITNYGLGAVGTISERGAGCRVGDLLVPDGGVHTSAAVVRIDAVDAGGGVTAAGAYTAGDYTRLPPTPSRLVIGDSHCSAAPVVTVGFYALEARVLDAGSGYVDPPRIVVGNGLPGSATITAALAAGSVFISGLPRCADAVRGQLCTASSTPDAAVHVR